MPPTSPASFAVPSAARLLPLALVAAVLAPASRVHGQGTASPGVVAGVVYDSLFADRPLADAEVWVEGSALTARTDAQGRFRLAGVPAGRHRVTFYHESLEALNLSAPPVTVDVTAGAPAAVTLVTPSPATVQRAFCPPSTDVKTGVLIGRLRGGEPAAPIGGATLALSWNVFNLGRGGFQRSTRDVTAQTAADGSFYACDVPSDVPVQVRAEGKDGMVSVTEATLRDRAAGFALIDLPAIPAALTDAAEAPRPSGGVAAPQGPGVVVGVLRTAAGRPVSGALVDAGGGASATTTAAGAFVLRGLPAGPATVEARALGFRPVRTRVVVGSQPVRLALQVSDNVVVLAPTRVTAPRYAAMVADYERRRRAGAGHYITSQEIADRKPYSINDMLVQVPGVRVILPDGGVPGASPTVLFQRGQGAGGAMATACAPIFFIDGVQFAPDITGGVDALLRPQDVYGIEVYRNLSAAPAQYQPLNASCGVVLIWTQRGKG